MRATTAAALRLARHGVHFDGPVFRNVPRADLAKHQDAFGEGHRTPAGVFVCDTGRFTGRSPRDKYVVRRPSSEKEVDWGTVNQPCTPGVFRAWHDRIGMHLSTRAERLYVFDGFCGARPESSRKVRFVTELAWQHHFVKNMFIEPEVPPDPDAWEPDFTVLNGCRASHPGFQADNLNSPNFVGLDLERKLGLIGGTWYGGEMKKGLFSMMNWWLPTEGVLPMHCAANVGADGDVALFFGLSGTGKTTLSTDPERRLIGDDEHGWDDHGIFNLEGGCYAKTAGLCGEKEPDIFRAIRPGALLENVALDARGWPDFHDISKTENGRVSYPLSHIDNHVPGGAAGHPRRIFFLTCDATGVLPPVAALSADQAVDLFLAGYTAKVAGTERGVAGTEATFSPCFGAAFLPRPPAVYARLLRQKIGDHGARVYLVNTGWSGGSAGTGRGARLPLATTRECIRRALDGTVDAAPGQVDPVFGFRVPRAAGPALDPAVLVPRRAWADKDAYDTAARTLAGQLEAHVRAYRPLL